MLECDLIMKGGITSGVVYPHAIVEIARDYRLRNIGGTSAGAIGAVFAAAAEYRRQTGGGTHMAGFDRIGGVADELGTDMGALFQPSPALAPLFELLLAGVSAEARAGRKATAFARAIWRAFRGRLLAGALVAVIGILLGFAAGSFWLGVLGVVAGALTAVGLVLWALYRLAFVELPQHDFGICSGRTVEGAAKPGFSDWIADRIDRIAGNLDPATGAPGPPLTVGQLRRHGIGVATMSTDLSSERPFQLPLHTRIHYFGKAEFEALFPPRVVDYLCAAGERREPEPDDPPGLPDDLYRLPVATPSRCCSWRG